MSTVLSLRTIIPSKEQLEAMGRRRYQKPSVQRTTRKNKRDEHWHFRARIDVSMGPGETRRVEKSYFLGMCSEIGKREAEQLRDQILNEAINKPAAVLQSQVLFGRVLDEFMELTRPDVRTQTANNYLSMIDCHIRPAFEAVRLCDMTPQRCQKWLQSLGRPHPGPRTDDGEIQIMGALSRSTRKKQLTLFRNIWDRAVDWNYTREICPLKRANLGPIERGREKTLPTVEQFRAIVQLLGEPFRSMLLVATFTGLRISEIRGLQWGDIARDTATIRRTIGSQTNEVCEVKTEASWRKVPVGHLAGTFSRPKLSDNSAFIFSAPYQTALQNLRRAAKAIGLEYEGFGWHTFRRASVTWGKRAGASQSDSMAQHGHSEADTNDLYYIEDDADLNRRAAQEAAMFDAVMFGSGKVGRG